MNKPDSPAQDPIPSAITVPSQKASAAEGLLLKLLEACAKHKRHHEGTDGDDAAENGEMNKKCKHELSSLAKILPRVEDTITVEDTSWDHYQIVDGTVDAASNPNTSPEKKTKKTKQQNKSSNNEDVMHLCALYRAIARSAFCPHAATFLFGDEEIMPRVNRLLGYLLQDPVGASKGDAAEEIANIIAELLLVLDETMQVKAVEDLICLANDLNTVEEAGVLFNPNSNCSQQSSGGVSGTNHIIRIQIFPQFGQQTKIEITSRRSLLSLQLGVWIVLKHMIPKQDHQYLGKISGGSSVDRTGIINQIVAAIRPILLDGIRNDTKSGWAYAPEDARIHSLLFLRTKSMIAQLLKSVASEINDSSSARIIRNVSPQHISLALLSVEAARVHLIWSKTNNNLDSSDVQFNLQCSRGICEFMLSTLLTNGIRAHCVSYLVDLIPNLVNQREPCLPRVALRILHAYIVQDNQAVILFERRCIAHGYFRHLFQLACDASESVSRVAVAIVTHLIDKTGDTSDLISCFDEVDFSTKIHSDVNMEDDQQQLSIQQGNKRRRLSKGTADSLHGVQGVSLHSALVHFVTEAMTNAASLKTSIDEHTKSRSPKRSSKTKSPIAPRDLPLLRAIAGILRILMSLRSISTSDSNEGLDEAIRRLYLCIQTVSHVLTSHEHDGINHIEPIILKQSLSLVTGVGHHAYLLESRISQSSYRTEQESISYSAIAALPLISDDSVEINDDSDLGIMSSTSTDGCCHNICSSLCAMIGIKATSPSDVCLCGFCPDIHHGSFLINDVLPLKFRCILLAALSPITADSSQHDTTLTSIQRILADLARPRDVIVAALISFPTLLMSLAVSKQDQSASTRYLVSLMESFDFELIVRHCQSEKKSIRVAAFLALARLNQMYAAASILASNDDSNTLEHHLYIDANTFLWNEINPFESGIDAVLMDVRHFNKPARKLGRVCINLPPSLAAASKSDVFKLQLLQRSPLVFLAAHSYIGSTLATLSSSLVQSFRGSEFLSNRKHYSYFDQITLASQQSTDCNSEIVARVPLPVWVLLAPLLAPESISKQVAKSIGPTLLGDQCRLFSILFTQSGDTLTDVTSKNNAHGAARKFFKEVEYLLVRFFSLPHAIITLEEGNDQSEGEILDEAGIELAVCLLQSLCDSAPLDSVTGVQMFHQSLIRLVRIWVAGTSTMYRTGPDPSPFSAARDAIQKLFANNGIQMMDLLKDSTFASLLFREFFMPSIKDSSPWSRYQLLVEFFEACLIPYTRTRGLPVVDVQNSFDVGRVVDKTYPQVITSMIMNEDIQGLEMCAAFRMYVVNELKTQQKKQKKSGDEITVGKQPKKSRPPSFARDLVAGVKLGGSGVSAKALTENMKMLCWKSHIIEHVLPKLLLHSDRSVLKFFTELCPPDISLSQILREKEQTVLKTLVWELGVDDPEEDKENELFNGTQCTEHSYSRKSVVLALKMGYLIKEGGHLVTSPEADDDISAAASWIGPNFLYLLVNVVLYRWKSRSNQDKHQTIKCLRAMLRFLPPEDSLKFMPQVMVAVSNAMGSNEASERESIHANTLRFLAVSTLFDFVKVLAAHSMWNVEDNLTSIVVILFPLFGKNVGHYNVARSEAVSLLLWLAEKSSSSFNEIPFLPVTPDLQPVRDLLSKKNIIIDDIRLISQQAEHDESAVNHQLQSKFYAQMNILSDLIAKHENKEVRKVVIEHMTKLIRANRDLFTNMIENETLASMHFLTVVHEETGKIDNESSINSGFVTKLLMRLLSRCVDEADSDIRDALACCLGEIGAIDPNRLGSEITSSQFSTENKGSDDWRLNQPPWKSNITRYQLHLVTHILVWCLKSAASTIDQHKMGFAIQELLKQINSTSVSGLSAEANTAKTAHQDDLGQGQKEMSPWLKEKLNEADVRVIVEPFWTSDYQQQDISAEKKPPYFTRSPSYFRWLSSLCRFLVTKSHSNEKSLWRNMFYACRSAIRSQAGIDVAEFILPLLVLDCVCFGEAEDQDSVISEFLDALSFEEDTSTMQLRERERAVNAVFTVLDVIRLWTEREMEQMRSQKKSKRSSRQSRQDNQTVGLWPVEESISKINHFLKRIPSSMCAHAASAVGMNARALRFLEIESRSKCGLHVAIPPDTIQGTKHLKLQYIDGIDLDLTETLFGKLNDFDTMVALSQMNHHHQSSLTKRLTKEAGEKELYGDVEGSCQAYEQLLDTRLNSLDTDTDDKIESQQGLLRCLLKLGKLDSVLNQAYGMSSKNSRNDLGISEDFLPSAAEAAWRLGRWSVLEQASDVDLESIVDPNDRHKMCLGRVMHAIHNKSTPNFVDAVQEARESVMTSLTSTARDSYTQSFPHLMQLHALREVELVSRDLLGDSSKSKENIGVLGDNWADRLNLSSPDSTGSNVIVNTRLALCRMANEPIAEGSLWLDIGKRARKGGLYQVAEQCLTHADVAFGSSSDEIAISLARESIGKVKLQFAKLKYALGESTSALNLIENDIPSSVFHLHGEELQTFVSQSGQSVDTIGRLVLQATEWMVSDGLKGGTEIRNRYQTVLQLVPNWERAHFHFGKWLDMLYENSIGKNTGHSSGPGIDNNTSRANAIDSDEKCQSLLIESINHYATALHIGQKHVYQALPRLLAMWTEFTAASGSEQSTNLIKNQSEVNRMIKSSIPKIPEHLFYTALPQLVSCILHTNKDTARNVMQILITVLSKYPCQTLWACNWLRFSKSEEKQKAGHDIFNGAKKILLKMENGKELQGMLDASKDLYKFLLQLARYTNTNATTVKMKAPKFAVPLTTFIPPIQSALSVTPGALDRSDVNEVFPQFVPRMRAFNLEVKIMQSKAKPKRISAFAVPATAANRVEALEKEEVSSLDIGEMHFLVKQEAKGDLRKDSRVQDLNNVINRLFAARKSSSGSNSRRQRLRLHLRTFSVVCLSEDCGVLEWVPNTESFRSLIGGTYNPQVTPSSKHRHGERVTNYNNIELRDAFMKCQDMYFKKGNLIGAAQNFDKNVLQEYLPFMYWWFVQNFPSPHAWFEARNNFTLSTAVWSAVGHVIGLGDRHSENILIDTRSGECVHVDFDCIFDKGLLLPRPEVIPFRLTPNMIDAFGPTGADGLYTGALVESMKTLRQNRDTLLSVLEPFLKDPVINFSSNKNQQKAQIASAKAVDAMRKIDGRLNGMYNLTNPNYRKVTRRDGGSQEEDESTNVALSVEGQVQRMINEATSHENLVQVYVGWMPWI